MPENEGDKLSLLDAVAMAVGGMVGGGIFAILGQAATAAGNGAFLAFGANGIVTLLTAMACAELGSALPEAGDGYLAGTSGSRRGCRVPTRSWRDG